MLSGTWFIPLGDVPAGFCVRCRAPSAGAFLFFMKTLSAVNLPGAYPAAESTPGMAGAVSPVRRKRKKQESPHLPFLSSVSLL